MERERHPMDDYEEHDHEVICSWDVEREKYEKRISTLEYLLEEFMKSYKRLVKRVKKIEGD